MKHFVVFSDDGTRKKLRVRSLAWPMGQRAKGLPVCAWCTRAKVVPFLDIVQQGLFRDFYRTLATCPDCGRVTCLMYYLPLENEPLLVDVEPVENDEAPIAL